MNYVEFRVNYNVLRALTPPVVELADRRRFRFPEPGSRDALCELIDTVVESAREVGDGPARGIAVRTDSSQVLSLSR